MIWGTISPCGLGPLVVLNSPVTTGEDYICQYLAEHLHPIVETVFSDKRQVFQNDGTPVYTCGSAGDWWSKASFKNTF